MESVGKPNGESVTCSTCEQEITVGDRYCGNCGATLDLFPLPPYTPKADDSEKQARIWGMACHAAALSAWIGVPFGHVIGPMTVWLLMRENHPFIHEQGREALNFQISMTIYAILSFLLLLLTRPFGLPLLIGLFLLDVILALVATMKAGNGESYRYPMTLRFIK